jgi:hypothetical protein
MKVKRSVLVIFIVLTLTWAMSCAVIDRKITHKDIVSWALAIYNGENDRILSIILRPDLPPETIKAIEVDIRNLKPEHIRTDLSPEVAKAVRSDLNILIELKPLLSTAGSLIANGQVPSVGMENDIIKLVRMLSNKYLIEGGG